MTDGGEAHDGASSLSRRPALASLVAALCLAVSLVPARAQDVDAYGRLADYATFFEPETAAVLGISPETGRLTDFSEEGLAARARGFEQLRAGLRGPPLFPNMPEDLAGAVDPRAFLDRRVADFRRVRAWARSPLYYVRAGSAALAAVALDPGLDERERRQALTERARQLPNVLDAASAALVNPPRVLSRQALVEGRMLARWIAARAVRAASLPEGGEKWALTQALEAAGEALRAFLDQVEADYLLRANGAPGLGEAVVSEIAATYGFDGAYHVLETLEAAVAALEAERRRNPAPAVPDSLLGAALPRVPLAAAVAARWPGAGPAPSVRVSRGPEIAGRGPVAAAWRPGAVASSGGRARVHVAEERAGGADLATRAVGDISAAAWLLPVVGTSSGEANAAWARTRLIVAWDGLGHAVRWFATAAAAPLDDPRDNGDSALSEARAARLALLVHLGRLDASGALERMRDAGAQAGDASRWLAGNMSDPAGVVAPALGFVLWERWRDRGRPMPARAVTEWLRAHGPRSPTTGA